MSQSLSATSMRYRQIVRGKQNCFIVVYGSGCAEFSKFHNRAGRSRKAVGSSRMITGVSCANALAIITFCRSPSLSSCSGFFRRWLTPVRSTAASMAFLSALSSLSKPSGMRKSAHGNQFTYIQLAGMNGLGGNKADYSGHFFNLSRLFAIPLIRISPVSCG